MGSYVPNTPAQRQEMLAAMGLGTMADLYRDVPESMKIRDGLRLPSGLSEWEVRRKVTALAARSMPDGYAMVSVVLEVKNKDELTTVINKLGQVQGVYQVARAAGK